MGEWDWVTGHCPQLMLDYLRGKITERKLRLFDCECARRIQCWTRAKWGLEGIAVAERLADGNASEQEVGAAVAELQTAGDRTADAEHEVLKAALATLRPDPVGSVTDTIDGVEYVLAETGGDREPYMGDYAALLRCIAGNPFRPVMLDPSWLTSTVVALAESIYADRAFDRLPILADALQDAGCENEDVLAHCRGAGPHARGCWVVDLLLGKT
jgi:hypothetical protein